MEETACTLWEKAQGCGLQPFFYPPLEGLELLFKDGRGRVEEHRHTET